MLYAEDLAVGQRFELGSYTISEDEIVGFAKQYDPVSIHIDKEAAGKGPFGGLIASSFNMLAVYQRLTVEAVWTQVAGIVGRSFEVRLSLPVRPGTCINGHSQIQSVTLRPERRDGVVIVRTELSDGSGQTILTVVADALIHSRGSLLVVHLMSSSVVISGSTASQAIFFSS
jgi:acyl dehydratase